MSEQAFPKTWTVRAISEIAKLGNGGTPPKANTRFWDGGTIPFVTAADLTATYVSAGRSCLTGAGLYSGKTAVCEPGDLLIGTRTRVGNCAIAETRMGASQDITRVRLTAECLPEFYRYYFAHAAAQLAFYSQGTSILGVTREILDDLPIPVPPLAEQRRLVARIEALTGRLEQAHRARQTGLAESETIKQAVWDRAFANVPEDRWVPIGKHARVQGGYAFKSEWFVAEGIRLLRNQNVYHGTLEWSDTVHLQPDRRGEFTAFELGEGDVVISMDRPLIKTGLKAARVSKADLPCLLLQRVGRFLCDDELDCGYLLHFLFSQSFIPHISGDGRSCAVPHISAKQIEAIAMPLPTRKEQGRIVEHLDAVQAKLDELQRLQREVEAELTAFTPALLAKAFKGEL